MYKNKQTFTKCNFCSYFLGNECTAAKANGKVNTYYCRQAQYEFTQWQKQQNLKYKKYF